MFLSIKDLVVNYGCLEVLKGVSLEIEEGGIHLLLGANGSGKSTLLKTISGLIRPASGTITFRDNRIDGRSPIEVVKKGIGHVPEGKRLFTKMTVKENLLVGAHSRNDNGEIAADLKTTYERFPILRKRQAQKSGKLSGGEQQALTISRALMSRPKLLLMDEPSQGLSPKVVGEVANMVNEISRSGITILMVEHNLRLGLSIADYIHVLENGRIIFKAKSTDLTQVEYARKIYLGG